MLKGDAEPLRASMAFRSDCATTQDNLKQALASPPRKSSKEEAERRHLTSKLHLTGEERASLTDEEIIERERMVTKMLQKNLQGDHRR